MSNPSNFYAWKLVNGFASFFIMSRRATGNAWKQIKHRNLCLLGIGAFLFHLVGVLVWNTILLRRSPDPITRLIAWLVPYLVPGGTSLVVQEALLLEHTHAPRISRWWHVGVLVVATVGALLFPGWQAAVVYAVVWLAYCIMVEHDAKRGRITSLLALLLPIFGACQSPTTHIPGKFACIVDSIRIVQTANGELDTLEYRSCFAGDLDSIP
jgi:hypothetical protein